MPSGDRMVKSIKIITSKATLYKKLNALHFNNEVVLDDNETKYIEKILRNINFKHKDIIKEKRNGKVYLRKLNPVNLNVFLKKFK